MNNEIMQKINENNVTKDDLLALCAYDIKWDTDGNAKVFNDLPERMFIPKEMVDNDVISDYLSHEIGFCHTGFKIGIMFRGSILPYYTNWLDSDTFQMWFGEDIFRDPEGDSYLIKFEKHLKDNEWVVEIIWEDDCTTINQICNADDYITANEIWKIERICEKMIQPDSNEVPETNGKGNSAVELGKTYQFAGYKWTACELINKGKTLVIQSHGVTHGKWPGFVMPQFGNGNYYSISIDGEDISSYDDKMQSLYNVIKEVEDTSATYGKGLYLISKGKVGFTEWDEPGSGYYWTELKAAAEIARSFGAANNFAWLGTAYGSTGAWYVDRNGNVYYGNYQVNFDYMVAPAFNLDLSKVEIKGDEIIKKAQPAPSSFEHDDNCQEHQLLGKTYKFAGYKWTVCELVNNGKTAVIQSHGVTHGVWPGYNIPQFGNGDYYSKSIDGEDISAYDNKMKELYDAIKDAEDSSTSYGKGLFLISKEKAGFTEWGKSGSGNYWVALKAVAENARQLEPGNNFVWLGTVDGGAHACCLHSSGSVHGCESGCNQNLYYVVAPAFNLDLSKVEIVGDEIIKKAQPAPSSFEHDDNCQEHQLLGKTYKFAGYKWTACELINKGKTLVIQSHGVTTGPWPGFKMPRFGNGHYYGSDIDGQDISSYDDKTQKLYDAIKDVEDTSATYGKGLYLVSAEKVQLPTIIYGASGAGYYCDAIVFAGSQGNPNGTHCNAWLGTLGNKENTAWFVNCFANGYITLQDEVIKTIAPAFNLDLSKVEIKGDEIIKKSQAAYSPVEQDDNCQEHQLLGKIYKFAGYNWTACELINNGKTLVIQSHGVTTGPWPGFVMPQFGNGNYYADSIDGQDISAYDNKMQTLYDAIKDAEDSSTFYGKGLFLISKEKAGFTEWGKSGSGNYWQALKKAAENARSFGAASDYAWLGTVNGYYAWYVNSDGNVYDSSNQDGDYVVAPAFNLDLSKVEIKGDEIIIKQVKKQQTLEIDKMLTISSRHVSADTKDLLDQAADDNEEDPMPPVYEKQGYGWFVACDPDNEETWDNYPADLVQCMKLTRNNGCFWLCLDADGPRVETLEFFD